MITLAQTPDKGYGSFVVILEDLIGRYINTLGFWEIHMYQLYSKLLKETDVVLDAGANIGFHTIGLAKFSKKVYAFEPQALIYNILTTNILYNDSTRKVEQFRLGLGNSNSTVKMCSLDKYREKDGTDNYGGRGIAVEGEEGNEEIKVVPFDSLGLDIDVIKMDVQNYELEALTGMLDTLNRCKPWMMLENYREIEKDQKVIELLKSLNYIVYRPSDDNPLPKEDCICFNKDNEKHVSLINTFDTNEQLKQFYKLV